MDDDIWFCGKVVEEEDVENQKNQDEEEEAEARRAAIAIDEEQYASFMRGMLGIPPMRRDEEEDDDTNICCICGEEYFGYGHNPRPVKNTGRCCNGCNNFVIATRIRLMMGKEGDPNTIGFGNVPEYYGDYFFDEWYRTYRESYPEYMEES